SPLHFPLSLHDALPIFFPQAKPREPDGRSSCDLRGGKIQEPRRRTAAQICFLSPASGAMMERDDPIPAGETQPPTNQAVALARRSEEHTSELQSRFDIV